MLFISVSIIVLPKMAIASDIEVKTDMEQMKKGDTVTVAITVSDENIAIAQGVFSYDHKIISYTSSTGGVSDGKLNMISLKEGGSSSLTAVIEFEAIGEGETQLIASIENMLDYDGKELKACQSSVDIEVISDESKQDEAKSEEDILATFELDGIEASNVFGIDSKLYIWSSVQKLTLPSGFVDKQVMYNSEEIGGATNSEDNGIILLYLSDDSGENAGYYVFDEKNDSLHPYVTVKSASESFTFLWPNESVTVPDGYFETFHTYDEVQIPAWMPEGSDGDVYLVYAQNDSGEKAVYQYIPKDKSLQRFIKQPNIQPVLGKVDAKDAKIISSVVFISICVISGVLFIVVIALIVLYILALRDKRELIIITNEKLRKYKKMLIK
jgi:hypothetical protein